ncbi:SDR family oxidoreductase [Leclercia adecarboxylata]|nr:SDR family oxidoreductase [Leclercia adecarboxylata]
MNVVSPGMIFTPACNLICMAMTVSRGVQNMTPFGRLGGVDEVATAVLFLASDERRFAACEALFLDGGIMAV